MTISDSELLDLPAPEQFRIIELLWNRLGESTSEFPVPDWVEQEGLRRLNELISNPEIGREHRSVWENIGSLHN